MCVNEDGKTSADCEEHCDHLDCIRNHNICCWCGEEMEEPNYDAEYDWWKERQLYEEEVKHRD